MVAVAELVASNRGSPRHGTRDGRSLASGSAGGFGSVLAVPVQIGTVSPPEVAKLPGISDAAPDDLVGPPVHLVYDPTADRAADHRVVAVVDAIDGDVLERRILVIQADISASPAC